MNKNHLPTKESGVAGRSGKTHEHNPKVLKGSELKDKRPFTSIQGSINRKDSLMNLDESEIHFRDLFNKINSCVAVYAAVEGGKDFIIKDFNVAAQRTEKLSKEEVLGRRVSEVFPGIREMHLLDIFRRVWKSGKPEHQPVTQYKDKSLVAWRENWVYKLSSGEIVAVYEDASERKQTEQVLIDNEEKFRILFAYAPDGYYLSDLKGNFIDGNLAAEKITGYRREELVGSSFLKLDLLPKNQIIHAARLLLQNARGYSTGPDEFILKRKDSVNIPVEITTHPVTIKGKKNVLGIARDISLRKQTEEALRFSEEKFSVAFQNIPDVIIITSIEDGKIIEANENFYKTSEYSREEVIGKTIIELNFWGKLRDRNKFLEELKKSGRVSNFETNFRRKSGELFTGRISGGVVQIRKKDYLLTVIHDVSERQRINEMLRLDNQMMVNISDGIFLYKPSVNKIIYVNPQFEKLFGYKPNELIGKPVSILNAPTEKTPKEISKEINKLIIKNGFWDAEIQNVKKDGTLFWSHASITSFNHSEHGALWICVQQDISERKRAEVKLQNLSTHDSLTGLYNRTFFDEEMSRLEKSRLFPVSIFMIDVDGLKTINDTQGHLVGDELLRRTAQVLSKSFRAEDIIARIGGDEFAIILPMTNVNATHLALKRINHFLEMDNKIYDKNNLRISIGISTCNEPGSLANTLKKADDRMYQDKRVKD